MNAQLALCCALAFGLIAFLVSAPLLTIGHVVGLLGDRRHLGADHHGVLLGLRILIGADVQLPGDFVIDQVLEGLGECEDHLEPRLDLVDLQLG